MKKLLWVAALFVSSCTFAADSDRAALEAALQRWTTAVNAQDVAALNATMTDDVQLLDEGTTLAKDPESAIRALHDVATRGRLTSTTSEVKIYKDIGWRVGVFVQTRKNGDVHSLGQSIEIWKFVSGTWKLHRLMAPGLFMPSFSPLSRPPPNEPVLDRQ